MAIINFGVTVISKPKKSKVSPKSTRKIGKIKTIKHKIIEYNLDGVIDVIDDTFVARLDNDNFLPIHKSSFTCKGVRIVYRKINDKFVTIVRSADDNLFEMVDIYYPFKPGSKVKGVHILDEDVHYFKIIKVK